MRQSLMVEFSQTAAMFMARPVSPQKQIRINMSSRDEKDVGG